MRAVVAVHAGVSLSALLVENPGMGGASLIPFGDCGELRPVLAATNDKDEGSLESTLGPGKFGTHNSTFPAEPLQPVPIHVHAEFHRQGDAQG